MAMTPMAVVDTFEDSTPLLNDAAALRERAWREGYLFFRQLLPRDEVLAARRSLLELARQHDLLQPGSDVLEGIARDDLVCYEGCDEWRPWYVDTQHQRGFHALAHHPRLLAMFEKVFDEPAIPHARNISRLVSPRTTQFTTPAHQDHIHIQGTPETWTSWIPVGDCPVALGGLAVLPGSHRNGVLPTHSAYGPGGAGVDIPDGSVWRTIDYECGDVVVFHSLNVHQGQDNVTPNRLRLSFDFRYQPVSHPIHPSSMEPHWPILGVTWDKIYTDWPADDPLRYFWKRYPLQYTS